MIIDKIDMREIYVKMFLQFSDLKHVFLCYNFIPDFFLIGLFRVISTQDEQLSTTTLALHQH